MIYGTIDERNEKHYTDMNKLFGLLGDTPKRYNWLITDCACNVCNDIWDRQDEHGYCWMSGEELTGYMKTRDIQWLFAVFSGFEKDISLEDILKYPLPYADENPDFWQNPIKMQHSLASVEIVPWDGCLTLFFSKDKELTEIFRNGYPQSEDLYLYNERP